MADDWAGIAMLALVVGGGIYILKEHPEFLQKKDMGGGGPVAPSVGPTAATPAIIPKPTAGSPTGATSSGTGKLDPNGITKLYPDASPSKYSNTTGGGGIEHQHQSGKAVDRREWEISQTYLNQEITCYVNYMIKNQDTMSIKLRGGPHQSETCACNYIHYLPVNGSTKFIGAQCPHHNYVYFNVKPLFTLPNVAGKWVGIKAVEWNEGSNAVHLQTWIDLTGTAPGKWQKWIDTVDKGGQGTPVMTKSPWSCPIARILMRTDFEQGGESQAKYISGREIIPPGGGGGGNTGGGGGGGTTKKSGFAEIIDRNILSYPGVYDSLYGAPAQPIRGAIPDYEMMLRESRWDLGKSTAEMPYQRITVV